MIASMPARFLLSLLWLPLLAQTPNVPAPEARAQLEAQTVKLRALVQQAPRLKLERTDLKPVPIGSDWEIGMVSWIAADRNGLVYLLQRGDKADPVIVMNRAGKVLRSWGKGMYTMPHAIRVDPQGNVWTTDAASSIVYKFSHEGKKLMQIEVGGQPTPCRNNFCSTTDIAFAKSGHLFISDGYSNARILEYTAGGTKVREWGSSGSGPGQFRLPHSIQIDENDIVYVADRENGRIQRFDARGAFLGEWPHYGKTFGLKLEGNAVWLATQPRDLPNLSPGWLLKVDRKTGELVGSVESEGNHGMDVLPTGDLLQAPGPHQTPQLYRRPD